MGQTIGSTNARGERQQDRPLHPNDVLATVYRHLGIDRRRAFVNSQGRSIPLLPHGDRGIDRLNWRHTVVLQKPKT